MTRPPSPLRVLLVDDEPLARERLARLLRQAGCEVLAELAHGPDLLAWLSKGGEVDGLFLDIHMPGGSGWEILAELASPPPVIFVTAFPEHASRAFDAQAVDYLLKPVYEDRLEQALSRLRAHLVPRRSGEELRALGQAPVSRFPVKAGVGHAFLELKRVTHFDVEDKIVWAWIGSQRFRTTWKTLGEVEAAFPEAGLLRIQRSLLLRPESVIAHRPLLGGRARVRVAEGVDLEVSRSAAPLVRERLQLRK
ncbi:MAG TPA: response regulator transcription factor [Holophagaceae bacterium]|nr:response regulator transcription factor [Holophagaceae bacterium]